MKHIVVKLHDCDCYGLGYEGVLGIFDSHEEALKAIDKDRVDYYHKRNEDPALEYDKPNEVYHVNWSNIWKIEQVG